MARGNDADAARRDLDSQYGADHQSAEDLIRAHDANLDPVRLGAAQKQVDPEATLAIDEPEPKFGGEVLTYAVRGGVLFVNEDVDGNIVKWHDDDPAGLPKKASKQKAAAAAAARTTGDPDAAAKGQASSDPATSGPQTGQAAEHAPDDVSVPKITDKLKELGVPVGDARRKDELWALLPESEQQKLREAASSS